MPTIEQLSALLERDPNDPFLHFGLAMALAKEGRDADALGSFDRAMDVDPNYVAAYFHKGRLLASTGRATDARSVLRKGIEIASATGDAHAAREMAEYLDGLADE